MSIFDQSAQAGSSFLDPIAAKIRNPFGGNPKTKNSALNSPLPDDFANGFFIQEYQNGVPINNLIQFVGNMMPMQPFPWEIEQRLVTDYYPGNPEPAVQVLGAKHGPLVIHGRFKDKQYQDPSYYGVSYMFSELLDAFVERGNLASFGFHGISGNWIRYGYLQKCSWKMNKLSWIDYELTFLVMGTKLPRNNFFAAPDKSAPDTVNQQLIAAATSFQSQFSLVPTTMPQSIAGKINDLINGVAKNVNLVTNFVSTVLDTAADIEASASRALGLIKNLKTSLVNARQQMGDILLGFSNLSTQSTLFSAVTFTDTQTNVQYLSDILAALSALSLFSSQLKSQYTSLSVTSPDTQYKVQNGDTLQRIAVKVYGAIDNWQLIYTHNNLRSTVLTPGQILEIPKL